MKRRRSIGRMLVDAVKSFIDDKASRLGAALAYYTVFSIPPLLIMLIGIGGMIFGREAVQGQVVSALRDLIGLEGARAIEDMLVSARGPGRGLLATLIGGATLLIGASGVFAQLKDALDTVWKIQPKPGRSLWESIRKYFVPMLVLLGTGFLLLVSLAVSTLITALGDELGRLLPGSEGLWRTIHSVIALLLIAWLFALMFRFIPDAKVRWRDALVGGAVTSLLFTLGKTLIGLYLGQTHVGSAFGAAGSLVVLLVWVYYSSLILLFGAELTRAWAERFGVDIRPDQDAVRVDASTRREQGMRPERRSA